MKITPTRLTSFKGYALGDRVRLDQGTVTGTVTAILAHPLFSNGGLPMARVAWANGSTGRYTVTSLVKVTDTEVG